MITKVPYLAGVETEICIDKFGDEYWLNLDNIYKFNRAKQRAILKVDLSNLVFDGVISREHSEERDKYLYAMMYDSDILRISETLQDVYLKDDQFKVYAGFLYYFSDMKDTYYKRLATDLHMRLVNAVNIVKLSIGGAANVFHRNGAYVYVAVIDNSKVEIKIPEGCEVELLYAAHRNNIIYK